MLVSVDAGQVSRQPRDSVRAGFRRYFAGAVYHAWEDLEPPTIEVSPTGMNAWVARTVCVDREEPGPQGGRRRRRFVTAYTATYRKNGPAWLMTSVTSTFTSSGLASCKPGAP